MSKHDEAYHTLLAKILKDGYDKTDRTGTGTRALFGEQLKFDLRDGFPLLTTKKMFTKGIFHELLWIISGSTNIEYLLDNDVHIWDEWTPAYKRGGKEMVKAVYEAKKAERTVNPDVPWSSELEIGPAYGFQWRNFGAKWEDFIPRLGMSLLAGGKDQLAEVIQRIKDKPDDRRLIVTAWNPHDVPNCQLPPCHCFFQFNVHGTSSTCRCTSGRATCSWACRST